MVAWSGQALIGRGTTQKTSAQGRVQDYKRLSQNERWMDGVQLRSSVSVLAVSGQGYDGVRSLTRRNVVWMARF